MPIRHPSLVTACHANKQETTVTMPPNDMVEKMLKRMAGIHASKMEANAKRAMAFVLRLVTRRSLTTRSPGYLLPLLSWGRVPSSVNWQHRNPPVCSSMRCNVNPSIACYVSLLSCHVRLTYGFSIKSTSWKRRLCPKQHARDISTRKSHAKPKAHYVPHSHAPQAFYIANHLSDHKMKVLVQ